jgi:cobalt-zinc-cadmium efflux system membrane fusion protein
MAGVVPSTSARAAADALVLSGRVVRDDTLSAHVYSPMTGRIATVNVQLGQLVSKGDVLATIEPADVDMSTNDVTKATAEFIAAKHDYERWKVLGEPRRAVEAAQDEYLRAKAELERAQQLERARREAGLPNGESTYALRSTVDGEVLASRAKVGTVVRGQHGPAPVELFTIGTLDPIWVLADVRDDDLARVRVGTRVRARPATADDGGAAQAEPASGQVDWVSETKDSAASTTQVRCRFENPRLVLRPDTSVTVVIE